MSNDLSVNMRRRELDLVHAEGVRRGQAIREALAMQKIEIARPHVAFGPKGIPFNQADADYLREAARNIQHSKCLGSNLTAAVMALLLDAARAIEVGPEPTDPANRPGLGDWDRVHDRPADIYTPPEDRVFRPAVVTYADGGQS